MTRQSIPLIIQDTSEFARLLSRELPVEIGHQAMLNHLSRAGGYRNWQHLRAVRGVPDVGQMPDETRVARAARHFSPDGLLDRFPGKTGMQMLCLWVLWARLPKKQIMTEREISARLDQMCCFRDAAQLRRSMVEGGLVRRNLDGSVCERVEQRPTVDAIALIARIPDPRSRFSESVGSG